MNEIILRKQSVKKNGLQLIFFVLICLFTSEHVIAQKQWSKNYVQVAWVNFKRMVTIRIEVYDYLFNRRDEHGYLERCEIEASIDGVNYFELMEIFTPRQYFTNTTYIQCRKKIQHAKIQFLTNAISPTVGEFWPNREDLEVIVSNLKEYGKVTLGWHLGPFLNIRYIRISGDWISDNPYLHYKIDKIVYPINISN